MNTVIVDTDHLGTLDAEIIKETTQLFANILVNAWTEITEAEEDGKRSFSFVLDYKGWWRVLGFDSPQGLTETKVEKAFKKAAKELHPDTEEGDHERMVQLNAARKAALDYVERSKPRDIPEGETRPEEADTI